MTWSMTTTYGTSAFKAALHLVYFAGISAENIGGCWSSDCRSGKGEEEGVDEMHLAF
jgi:hypothetical protein